MHGEGVWLGAHLFQSPHTVQSNIYAENGQFPLRSVSVPIWIYNFD